MRTSLDVVNKAIELAEKCRTARRVADAGKPSIRRLSETTVDDLRLLTEEAQLEQFIDGRSDAEKAELIGLALLGRGTDGDDFEALVRDASDDVGDAGEYLAEKDPLADYLREGLRKLGIRG